jgi:phage terminase large subunit-like protein
MKPYYRYADDVTEGKIVCGESIKLACKRFKADLQREDLVFKESVVDRAISFISTLKHFAGKSSGSNFILEDWQ